MFGEDRASTRCSLRRRRIQSGWPELPVPGAENPRAAPGRRSSPANPRRPCSPRASTSTTSATPQIRRRCCWKMYSLADFAPDPCTPAVCATVFPACSPLGSHCYAEGLIDAMSVKQREAFEAGDLRAGRGHRALPRSPTMRSPRSGRLPVRLLRTSATSVIVIGSPAQASRPAGLRRHLSETWSTVCLA